MKTQALKKTGLFLLVFLSLTGLAQAQTAASGTVNGIVTDATGAVVPGAKVELVDLATNVSRTTETNAVGQYSFVNVTPGTYKVTVTQQGFRQATVPSLRVEVAKSHQLNFTLEVGGVAQTVEVVAGGMVELQTSDATVGAVLEGEKLLRLPNITRSAAQALTLQPLVQPLRGNIGATQGGQVAGARSDQNTYNLDGADATDLVAGTNNYTSGSAGSSELGGPMVPVPSESIEEFRVGTTNPNATFGRSAGGQGMFVTKRGTNSLHGSAYWYHQNDNLNANRWEFNRGGFKRPELKDNRFGFSAGGPIWKDHTFIYGHYEGRRFLNSASVVRYLPSPTLKAGTLRFRDAGGNVVSYPVRNFDPRGLGLSPVVKALWDKLPEGNDPTAPLADGLNTLGFRGPAGADSRSDFGVLRLDHVLTDKWRFDGTFRYSTQEQLDVTQLDIAGLVSGHQRGQPVATASTPIQPRYVTAKLVGTPTSHLTNEFVFGWARNFWSYKRVNPFPQVSGTNAALMVAGGSGASVILDQGVDVDTQRGRSRTWWDNLWQYTNNTTWVKGTHMLQFGGSWRRMPVFHQRDDKVIGSLTSLVAELDAGSALSVRDSDRPPTCSATVTTNCLLAGDTTRWNRLFAGSLGLVDKAGILATRDANLNPQPFGKPLEIRGQFHAVEGYVSDIWRMRPSLTLSYGVTYQVQTPPVDQNGKQTVIIDPATGKLISSKEYFASRQAAAEAGRIFNPTLGWQVIRKSGQKYIYDIDWNNLGPRIAASWNPSARNGLFGRLLGDRKTVFRGGYGLTFDRTNGVGIIMVPILGVGFGQTINCTGPRRDGTCAGSNDPSNAWRVGVDGTNVPLPPPLTPVTPPVVPGTPFQETLSFQIDPKLSIGRSQGIDFTIQRELRAGLLLEVGYVSRISRNLPQNVEWNSVPYFMKDGASGQTFAQAFDAVATQLRSGLTAANVSPQPWFENQLRGGALCPGTGSCTTALAAAQGGQFRDGVLNTLWNFMQQRRPGGPITNLQVLDMFMRFSAGRARYDAFLVTLRKRMRHGLAFDFNYTLSKSLDHNGLNQENIGLNSTAFDLDVDYGPTLFDRRHVFNFHWFYELPFWPRALERRACGQCPGGRMVHLRNLHRERWPAPNGHSACPGLRRKPTQLWWSPTWCHPHPQA